MGNAFKISSVIGVTIIVIFNISNDKTDKSNPFISATKTETNIPTRTKIIGNLDFLSTRIAIKNMGTNTEMNRL
jgi:uncharacterized protein YxeA